MPPGSRQNPPTGPTPCRECHAAVTAFDLVCPHCHAPRPAWPVFTGDGCEWKTEATWLGLPWIHVAFGLDASGQPRTARGIVAIGQRAVGVVALGIVACGFVSIGLVSLGLISIGVVAVAALAAVGLNAIGPYAIGVVAAGFTVGGVAPFGWKILFSAI